MEVRRLTARKEEIYRQLLGDRTPLVPSGVRHLIDVLGKHQVNSLRPILHLVEVLEPPCYGSRHLPQAGFVACLGAKLTKKPVHGAFLLHGHSSSLSAFDMSQACIICNGQSICRYSSFALVLLMEHSTLPAHHHLWVTTVITVTASSLCPMTCRCL